MYDEFLKNIPLFASMSEADLERLCRMIGEVRLEAGQVLFTEGSSGDQAYVIKEGEVEIFRTVHGRELLLAVRGAGEVIGEMALLESQPRNATVRARTPCQLLVIQQEQLDSLLSASPSAVNAVFRTILARWRSTESHLRQSEKMAQLGTLTSGVAHELNNPAAAVRRSAKQLQKAVEDLSQAQAALNRLALTPEQETIQAEAGRQAQEQARQPSTLNAISLSDRQDELEGWLESQGMLAPWDLAPVLAGMGYDIPTLAALALKFDGEQLQILLRWVGATFTLSSLIAEIDQGTAKISEIVTALKSYTYLDQAPVQNVDVRQGLENSLLVLKSKIGPGVQVRREYAPALPQIQACGSELNQAWSYILDNAIDAVNGQGEIIVRARPEREGVRVEIEDTGPGIDPEILPRIFDPFFTTKPPGQGTGLGLDITYNTIVNKHRGSLQVESRPGQTCFQIWLPIEFEKPAGGSKKSS